MNITLGCDPELFLIDKAGHYKASCGLIGGSKRHPMPLTDLGDGFAVQEDNVAVEFNIPPAKTTEEFINSVRTAVKFLETSINNTYGFSFSKESSALFPLEELLSPAAQEFGCDPDFNAWTGGMNPRPEADDPTLRSCGGHVHVGYSGNYTPDKIIRVMDLFLGVPSILMDKGERRKKLYGKCGAYRPKPFGVEYRTLSNWWVFDDRLIKWVAENTKKAVDAVESQFPVEKYKTDIITAIDGNDKSVAERLVKTFNLEVVHV